MKNQWKFPLVSAAPGMCEHMHHLMPNASDEHSAYENMMKIWLARADPLLPTINPIYAGVGILQSTTVFNTRHTNS